MTSEPCYTCDDALNGWSKLLHPALLTEGLRLQEKAKGEAQAGNSICPPYHDIFRALYLTPPERVKVVIFGQDPYHTRGVANGLAFSTNEGFPIPPSLRNIFNELNSDLGIDIPNTGDLSPWAKQGVLLLNTVLTVYEGRANSCANWGWQNVTEGIARACFSLPQPIVFVAWGRQARLFIEKAKANVCNNIQNKECVCSSHPSPLGAYKSSKEAPAFMGSKPFSKTNSLLKKINSTPIDWRL